MLRRIQVWGYTSIVLGHGPLVFGLGRWLSSLTAVLIAAGVCSGTVARLLVIRRDGPRPWFVTRFFDEPLFCHWAACMVSMPLFVAGLGVGGGAIALGSSSSSIPDVCETSGIFAYALGLVVAAWGIWGRRRFVRVVKYEIPIEGLDPAFDGYRILHLSDLHIGSYDRLDRGLEWIELANQQRSDLALVTGDLVTSGTSFYEDASRVLGALRSPDGVFVSPGNHDQWDEAALIRRIEARGPKVLRNESICVERNGARLHVAGLGDWYTRADDLDATLAGCQPRAPVVLMSHYPRFFEAAARRGVALTLSGHTHGGQIGIPGFVERFNVAALSGQPASGLFWRGKSALYVTSGLGTTGPPLRLGVPPEIAVLILRSRSATMA